MILTTRNMCDLFNISHTTVKAWCAAYAPFLSEAAKPGPEKHRSFSLDDLRVFSYVSAQKKRGIPHDDIFASLLNGERGELPPTLTGETLVMDRTAQIVLLENRIQQLEAEVLRLRPFERETIELSALLKDARKQAEDARHELREAYKAIGRLEADKD